MRSAWDMATSIRYSNSSKARCSTSWVVVCSTVVILFLSSSRCAGRGGGHTPVPTHSAKERNRKVSRQVNTMTVSTAHCPHHQHTRSISITEGKHYGMASHWASSEVEPVLLTNKVFMFICRELIHWPEYVDKHGRPHSHGDGAEQSLLVREFNHKCIPHTFVWLWWSILQHTQRLFSSNEGASLYL